MVVALRCSFWIDVRRGSLLDDDKVVVEKPDFEALV
jgi:hypothetical protein